METIESIPIRFQQCCTTHLPLFPKSQQNLISLFNMKARMVLRLLNSQSKIEEIQPFITNFVIISMSRGAIIFTILS